jgi:hypothetical protein
MHISIPIILALATSACALPTHELLPRLKPYQLRGVQSPIFHLYLQALPSNKSVPVMGPEKTSEYLYILILNPFFLHPLLFPFSLPLLSPSPISMFLIYVRVCDMLTGVWWRSNIGSTIQSTNTSQYLNIGTNTKSFKPLSFGATATTTAWALEGDTIITGTASSYGRRMLTFFLFHQSLRLSQSNSHLCFEERVNGEYGIAEWRLIEGDMLISK